VAVAGAVTVIVLLDREAELFGPAVATMAAIYLAAYGTGRPVSAWPAFVVLSGVVSVLHVLRLSGATTLDPAVGMSGVLLVLWCWLLLRRLFTDVPTFWVQTAGMVAFGALTLLCAAVQPALGTAVAGAAFLAHGAWDMYHFKADKVVNRPWSEFCAVVDAGVGTALIAAALL
jgi:hypothetical protein